MAINKSAPLAHIRDDLPQDLSGAGSYSRLQERLGVAICGGELTEGTFLTVDDIEKQYGVSRSVVRESVRVLVSMGLLLARQRVGLQVLPSSRWNLYDPQVIRWRLASPARLEQLRGLVELRGAVEPEAARFAAERSTPGQASAIMAAAGRLWAAGQADDREEFLRCDIEFHSLVLASSNNVMFAKLDSIVGESLSGRSFHGLEPDQYHTDALQLHVDVASHIQRREAELARKAMRQIILKTVGQIEGEENPTIRRD